MHTIEIVGVANHRRGGAAPSRLGAVVLVLGLVLASCSGGGDTRKADTALVRAANVQAADLPPEWTPVPPVDPVANEGDGSRFAQCVGRPDPKQVRTATADSPQFQVEDRSRVTSTVQAVRTQVLAVRDFDALEGGRAVPCLRQRLQAQLDRQSTPGRGPSSFTVERLPGPSFGDRTVAFRATVTYKRGTGPTELAYYDLVNVLKGRVEVLAGFFNTGEPFPPDLEQGLLTKVVNRAAKGPEQGKS